MSISDINKYSKLWTDVDNYALLPLLEDTTEPKDCDICVKYSGGYEIISVDAKYVSLVVEKMLSAGVKVVGKKDIDEANQPYHLWTDRLPEFVLVRLAKDPERKMI